MTGAPIPPARPAGTGTATAPRGRQNGLLVAFVVIVVVVLAVRACAGRENTYEHVTRELNVAIQRSDLAAVKNLSDTATADAMSRARLGAATDALSPLGKLERVKEVPPSSTYAQTTTPRLHQFDVTFQHGTVREQVTFNSKDQVVHFHYEPPVAK